MNRKDRVEVTPEERARLSEEAKRMRAAGLTYDEIGRAMGWSSQGAHNLVNDGPRVEPSRRPSRDWIGQARDMRDRGATLAEIAAAVGRSKSTVAEGLDPARAARAKASNERLCAEIREAMAARKAAFAAPSREARTPRRVLADPQVKREAVRAFGAGEISRAEMMARITVSAS